MRIPAGLALALAVGVLWWWAVLRLVLAPADAGPVEGAVAVGGWGLGLLPVHCVPKPVRRRRGAGRRGAGGEGGGSGGGGGVEWAAGSVGAGAAAAGEEPSREAATRASRLHRSDEGSGPS
ncbi:MULTISPECIES: hypothetical protein [unclassified Streptomyces]|uniref:hypothetical protein n=1 Tax=unclassified Streptomyces TaxID=2593676 RepID=UPI000DC796A8|nr:hypothetical protein DRB89_32480 [Streptomyces sp. ICC4]AWZ18405.1 hypothetical protein DRB96_33335 [Streptomyces sp. ICC1]